MSLLSTESTTRSIPSRVFYVHANISVLYTSP